MSLSGQDFIRYSRHLLMADVGEEGQEALLDSRVLVVGAGGLGCPVSLYLAAAGVGRLTLCDPDEVELTNLQRQVLYGTYDCGRPKVVAAREALERLNPGVVIEEVQRGVDEAIWQGDPDRFDVVVDCTDNLAARHWLNRQCLDTVTPLISASAMGWEGMLMQFDFVNCPSICLACAIPEGSPEPVANCSNSGVIGPVLGTMGSMQAIAVIKTLLGQPMPHGQVQRFDARAGQWLTLSISRHPDCPVCEGQTEE